MLSITREFAARSSKSELQMMLNRLFNLLAEDDLHPTESNCCHASVKTVKCALAQPGRF